MSREGIIEGRGPVYDSSDDPDGDDFVNANDRERKTFIPIDDVPDRIRDFSNSINVSHRAKLAKEADELLEASDEDLKNIRKDISQYTYYQKGSEVLPMETFHVDHDSEKITAIHEEKINQQRRVSPELVEFEDAPSEESFAKHGIAQDRKINSKFIPYNESRAYAKNEYSNKSDNLKTRPLRKRLRDARGEIREHLHEGEAGGNNRGSLKKFLSKIWSKN